MGVVKRIFISKEGQMKNIVAGCVIAILSSNAFAADEFDASSIVRKYSQTVACQLEDISDYQKNQYRAVTIKPGIPDLDGMDALFVVYWEGDVGCSGGNGTVTPNFTVVEHAGFSSVDPVVTTNYKFPNIELIRLTSISGGNGQLLINGVTYGPDDTQHSPTKVVSYTLKLIDYEFVIQ